jgi:hypothetical protein
MIECRLAKYRSFSSPVFTQSSAILGRAELVSNANVRLTETPQRQLQSEISPEVSTMLNQRLYSCRHHRSGAST